jgi:hypothetical protein
MALNKARRILESLWLVDFFNAMKTVIVREMYGKSTGYARVSHKWSQDIGRKAYAQPIDTARTYIFNITLIEPLKLVWLNF